MSRDRTDPPPAGSRAASRVLVVDDEEVMRRMMAHAIGSAGHWCASAASGHEALALLKNHSFDLGVYDKNLPDISGLEIVRRTRDMFRKIPVIIVTGFPSDESREEAESLGVASYLVKPFDVEALRQEVGTALDEFWRISREPASPSHPPVAPNEVPTRPPPRPEARKEARLAAATSLAPIPVAEDEVDLDVAVLLVEADDALRRSIAEALEEGGCRVVAFRTPERAELHALHVGFDVLVARPELIEPTKHWAAAAAGGSPLGTVALVESESVERHIEAIQAGARGVLTPPFTAAKIVGRFAAALEQLRRDRRRLSIPPPPAEH